MDQKMSQSPPGFGDEPLAERLVVSRGGKMREENGRVELRPSDKTTVAKTGAATAKADTSSPNRPNSQAPQACPTNIESRARSFSPNARPSGLPPRKYLSSENRMEGRHIHASHSQGRISSTRATPPAVPMAGSADVDLQTGATIASRGLQDAARDAMARAGVVIEA